MEFLSIDQVKKLTRDVQLRPTTEVLNEDVIDLIKSSIELKPITEFAKGKCITNAVKVAEITKANIIEGIAHVIVAKDGVEHETFIKHAWNILNDIPFDVTNDFVWPNLNVELKSCSYLMVKSFKFDDYVPIVFKSNAHLIALSLRYAFTKNNVLTILSSIGLEKEHFDQLLRDCIDTLQKKEKL